MKKVSNFALAFGNEVRHSGADNTSPAKKFKKKVSKNFGNSKISCNFATLFARKQRAPEAR